jgi:hypothetical protein
MNDLEKRVTRLENLHIWAGFVVVVGVVIYIVKKYE